MATTHEAFARSSSPSPGKARAEPRKKMVSAASAETKTINLALQGGGAHGAFAWGVLDRLLEDERINFDGISATSAGAMNATVLAYGLCEGGRDGAKRALANFWRRVSHVGMMSPMQPSLLDRVTHNRSMEYNPAFLVFDLITRLLSPYQFNPCNVNPLREVLLQVVDFDRLRADNPIKLFLCATNVRTGKVRIFDNADMSVDAVLASGCLPFIFQAVTIDGEAYWDGGYVGNPAIYPLIYHSKSLDVVVVHINPLRRAEVPQTATEIFNRINEISFNSSLMREMRAISFVTKLIDNGQIKEGEMNRMLVHAIDAEEFMRDLDVSSKLNPDWDFLEHLRDVGREATERWLAAHFDDLNHRSTIDIKDRYL